MKIKDALKLGEPLEAEVLLSFVLQQPKEYLYAHPENNLTYRQEKNFRHRLGRRAKGEPVAYLTGHKEFFGLDFLVDKSTLIPRPESELLIEEVLKNKNVKNIIDIGTGSGCLAIALAKHLPDADIIATDISLPALKIAKQNALRHSVEKQIKFIPGSLLQPIRHLADNTVIIANLPYLNRQQMSEPSIKFEPATALYGGADGLEYYTKLFRQLTKATDFKLILEIDPAQAKKITKLAQEILPGSKVEIKKDLAGRDRVCVLSFRT
jgi:release factor glutamine methyltransferase